MSEKWLDQSYRQVQAAGQRQVIWYFAEQRAAAVADELFSRQEEGRERILIRVQPANNP